MVEEIKALKKRVRLLEEGGEGKGGEGERSAKTEGIMEERITEIEKRIERKEREERRKNIMIKEIKVTEGKKREVVEKILEEIGAKAKIEEIRRIGGNEERGTELL